MLAHDRDSSQLSRRLPVSRPQLKRDSLGCPEQMTHRVTSRIAILAPLFWLCVACSSAPPEREVPTAALTHFSRGMLAKNRGDTARAAFWFDSALVVWPRYEEACVLLKQVRPAARCG